MALKISEGHTQHRVVGNSATVLLDPTGGGRLASGAVGQPTEEHRRTQPTSVISVGVIDEKSFTRQCITRCLQTLGDRFDIVPFATCDDFLQSKEVRDIILYHIHGDTSSWNEKNDHFISVKKLLDIVPVIILSERLIPLVPARLGMVRSAMRSLDGNPRTFLLCSHGEPVEA